MTDRELMQQALDALEGWANHGEWVWPESALEQAKRNTTESIAALRERLAQPEPGTWREVTYDQLMEEVRNRGYEIRNAKIVAPQPEQQEQLREENERLHVENRRLIDRIETIGVPVGVGGFATTTTAQPSKPWVSLTDEEMHACWDSPLTPLGMKHARMIEAKLKEKNG